jgi:hypothetical protein
MDIPGISQGYLDIFQNPKSYQRGQDSRCQYPLVQATKSGASLKEVPKLCNLLVAYMEGLLAMSPYLNCPFNSRAKGVAEAVAAVSLQLHSKT